MKSLEEWPSLKRLDRPHLVNSERNMITFKIKIADIVLEINAFNETTKRYCKDFLCDEESDYVITMTEEDLKNEASNSNDGHVYVNEEISALYRKIADLLIERNIVVFHSSAIKVNGYAYLITARSGVGKSTHTNLLKEYLKEECEYINDDKPLVAIKENEITVYSTPWNGKERRGNNISAPLRSVIFLNRGINNTYQKVINKQEIYINLLSQIYLPKEKDKREKALKVVDTILKRTNFYIINVNKDLDAAIMTYERIIKDEIK